MSPSRMEVKWFFFIFHHLLFHFRCAFLRGEFLPIVAEEKPKFIGMTIDIFYWHKSHDNQHNLLYHQSFIGCGRNCKQTSARIRIADT